MNEQYKKMISGEFYEAFDNELVQIRTNTRNILQEYNSSAPNNSEKRKEILNKLFNAEYKNTIIEPPFYCDYGVNIELGENVYMNFGCTVLDCAKVKIGSNTFIGPSCGIYTPLHPLDAESRRSGLEYAKSITIGNDCWLGGNVTVLPGVTIGDNCVIGAGSVVTKNIPDGSLAFGNPAKIVKTISKQEHKTGQ